MKLNRRSAGLLVATLASTAACGASGAGAVREIGGDAGDAPTPRIEVCKLLSEEQVRGVLPDLVGNMRVANGESLMKTVESYQCSHVNKSAEGGLIVEVHFAADDASFKLITIASELDTARKLDIGDASWLYPKDGGLNVTVHQGRTLIDVHLFTKDAAQREQALTELARAVAARVK
jgi:hypothetical protein